MPSHIQRTWIFALGAGLWVVSGGLAQAGQSVLFGFPGGNEGSDPMTNTVIDAAGNVYGETSLTGSDNYGTLFRYAPASGKLTTLLAFDDTTGRTGDGNLLLSGTTIYAPEGYDAAGFGRIFSLQTNGTGYALLHEFSGTDGARAQDQLARAADGTLYGTARAGGLGYAVGGGQGNGVLFEIAPSGAFSVLYEFTNGADGYEPTNIALGSNGVIYGSTRYGGVHGGGEIYSFVPATGVFTVLHSFDEDGSAGQPWLGGIYQGQWLFGSATSGGTTSGGATKGGALFALKTNGTGYRVLWDFNEAVDGGEPLSPPVLSPQGTLVGTTSFGPGVNGFGTLYEYTSAGLTVLNAFEFDNSNSSPSFPYGSPAVNAAGDVFGTTELGGDLSCGNSGCGTIYENTP